MRAGMIKSLTILVAFLAGTPALSAPKRIELGKDEVKQIVTDIEGYRLNDLPVAWLQKGKELDKEGYLECLYVLDDKTLDTIKTIALGKPIATLAVPTQPQVPFVYVSHERGNGAAME